MAVPQQVTGAFALVAATLAERAYGRYVAGNTVSLIGNWMQRTAIGWLAWDLTGSATWLGLVAFSDLFPTLIMGPIGGVLADRYDRLRQIMACQMALLLVAAAMWLLVLTGALGIGGLLVMTTLHGLVVGLNQPARLALVSSLVARERLHTAIAINSVVFNGARFIGPALAGILIASVGTGWTFFANMLTYLPFLWALATISIDEPRMAVARAPFVTQIVDGLRHVRDEPRIRLLFAAFIAAALLVRPIGELLPALADGVFNRGAVGLAMLSSTLGAGAVLGGLVMSTLRRPPRMRSLAMQLMALTAALAALALAPTFALALPLAGLVGVALIVSGVSSQTLMQMAAPPELRGRVMSLFGIVFRAAPAVGALTLGGIADLTGLATALLLGAASFIVAFAFIWRRAAGIADEPP